jgi:ppGpp synthetase/RelA/SpoT-type nucleotidyltranferase
MQSFFFANRTLVLKETSNSIKQSKKNKNYNKILEKPFIFNLQTVSTARRRCRSSLSRFDVVDCRREVAERVKKTTSILKTKKKDELPLKLLDDPKIPTAR